MLTPTLIYNRDSLPGKLQAGRASAGYVLLLFLLFFYTRKVKIDKDELYSSLPSLSCFV